MNSVHCIEVDLRYKGQTNPGLRCTCKMWARIHLCSHVLFVGALKEMCTPCTVMLRDIAQPAKGGRKKKVRKALERQPGSPNATGGKGVKKKKVNANLVALKKRARKTARRLTGGICG